MSEPMAGETMGQFWQRTCPACVEAQECGERLCADHEDGDTND